MFEYEAWLPGANSSGREAADETSRRAGITTRGLRATALPHGSSAHVVRDPARVVEQVPQADPPPLAETAGQKSLDGRIEAEPVLGDKLQDHVATKLFVTLPTQKRSFGRILMARTTSACPAAATVRRPSCSKSAMTPGMSLLATRRSAVRCSSGPEGGVAATRTAPARASVETRRTCQIRREPSRLLQTVTLGPLGV